MREAAQSARNWLAAHQLGEAEVVAWELALVEAGNNAVEHVSEAERARPLGFELLLGETEVEARITDHTPGFDFPDQVDLPDFESEGGRGLFLIKTLTDQSYYLRGASENQMVLRKRRSAPAPVAAPSVVELQQRLAENEMALNEMSEELASSYESLVAMFRYSAELGTNSNLREFALRLLNDLLQLTETDAVVLRLWQENQLETYMALPGKLQSQLPALTSLTAAGSIEAAAAQSREDVWFSSAQPLPAADPLRAITDARFGLAHAFGSSEQLLGTLTLVRTRSEVQLRSAQVNLLHTLADFLAIQIVNTRLLDERTQSRITRRELDIAANIQRSQLPLSLPSARPFELAASCTNAREVGGDFYDVISVGSEGLLLVIADVMGKGVPAALFAAVLRSAIRSMPALFADPAALLTSVNRTLYEDLSRVDMFVTVQAVFLDVRLQRVISASAGHCPLLLWQPGRPVINDAENASLPLGVELNVAYAQTETAFPPGTVALLYTDGLTESVNAAGKMLGMEGLEKIMPNLSPEKVPAAALVAGLLAELDAHRNGMALNDDQTFIIIRHAI